MRISMRPPVATVVLGIAVLLARATALAAPLGTAFTYQGQLKLSGSLVTNNNCYFTFRLYDAASGGTLLGQVGPDGFLGSQSGLRIAVNQGLFSINLDFGPNVFTGDARWLETSVCCFPPPPFEVGTTCSQALLSPRQPVNAVPYSVGLRLPFAESTAELTQPGMTVTHTNQGTAVKGVSSGVVLNLEFAAEGTTGGNIPPDAIGVLGESLFGEGVKGSSSFGIGVSGSGPGAGVKGASASSNGVFGLSAHFGASGVYGQNDGGGFGIAGRTTGLGTAVYGDNTNPSGWAGVFDGRVRVNGMMTATGYLTNGADIGEHVESTEPLEPGDVVEIDPHQPRAFRRAATPYSTLAAGVVSSEPGVTLNSRAGSPAAAEDPILALAGRVPVKATAINGPIQAGDLLTPSALPGHAMRCEDRLKCTGAIVGKALEGLEEGTGMVQVLVTLQ
jgi:hypothetical protein